MQPWTTRPPSCAHRRAGFAIVRAIIPLILALLLLVTAHGSSAAQSVTLDAVALAASHPITYDKPGPTFFTGALLGNGGLGAVVCTRPDAIMIHFGHNDVWDQRIALDDVDKLGTFDEIFPKMRAIPAELDTIRDDAWYESYRQLTRQNYAKPYPRPMPCGTLVLGVDPRRVEMLDRYLDISNGLCRVNLQVDGEPVVAELFVEMKQDRLWIRLLDAGGNAIPTVFDRIHLFEDPKTPEELPRRTALQRLPPNALGFRQTLPYNPPPITEPHPKDRAFAIAVQTSATLETATWPSAETGRREPQEFERRMRGDEPFVAVVQLEHGTSMIRICQEEKRRFSSRGL